MKNIFASAFKAGVFISALDIFFLYLQYQGNNFTFVQKLGLGFLNLIIFQMVVYEYSFSFKNLYLTAFITLNICNISVFMSNITLHYILDTNYKNRLAQKNIEELKIRLEQKVKQRNVKYVIQQSEFDKAYTNTLNLYSISGLSITFFLMLLFNVAISGLYGAIGLIPFEDLRQ